MRFLSVYRSERFSPNMVSADAAILDAVSDRLKQLGHSVVFVSEDKLTDMIDDIDSYNLVFGMMRDSDVIEEVAEKCQDTLFLNPLYGVLDCNERVALLEIFMDENISMPACALYTHLGIKSNDDIDFPFWIKKGDGCAQVKEDTCYVTTNEEASSVIDDFKSRGITSFAVQRHIAGDLIKFYGVEGTDFFYWRYASDGHSKFGLESINGKEHGYPFSVSDLKRLADKASVAVDVPVYGGDCVVTENGDMFIIDFNDWPSFSCCREEAAAAIVTRIMSMVEKIEK